MEFFLPYFILILVSVLLTSLFFLKTRVEPANAKPEDLFKQQFMALQARVHVLENKKMGKVELVEFSEAIKQISADHIQMKKDVLNAMTQFNEAIMQLRMIKHLKERKTKEIRA